MRALIQRVRSASVQVDEETVGTIHHGLLVFVGIAAGDTTDDLACITRKIKGLRIFEDADGRMQKNVSDVGGAVLCVSQFTLCARTHKGNRPSFTEAMEPAAAARMFDKFVDALRTDIPVETGRFGAMMHVSLVNDGPVTIWLDSRDK